MDKKLEIEIKDYVQECFEEFKVQKNQEVIGLLEELKKDIETIVKWKFESETKRIDSMGENLYKKLEDHEKVMEDIKEWINKFKKFNHSLKEAVELIDDA